jgi:hypothetical protein
MKSIKSLTLFLALSLFFCSLSSYCAKNLATPKATGLKNAYGAPINHNPYGPQENPYTQYIEANPDTFTPFKFDGKKKIQNTLAKPYNSKIIKAGDMTNIAPSAEKIIKPEIAVPKLNVDAEVIHSAEVRVPTYKGMKKEFHPVTAYDKATGQIVHDTVFINRPVYELESHVNIFYFKIIHFIFKP